MTKSGNLGWSQNETRHDTLVEFVLCQFCGHLGWFESLKWCQGKGVKTQGGGALQWMGVEGGARVWGCRITCAKWHHEWRRVSSKSHSWCHLAQVILHPQGLEPLPQPHSLERPLPHWVETPLPWHHFRDLTHPRCPQNWHKTDETGAQVVFHFVTTPSSQTRAQVNFLSWTPFWRPFCPFFLPYDRPSKGSGLSELLVAQDTVKMQGIFFDTPHQSSFVILCMFYFFIYRRIPSYLREGKPQL